MTTDSKLRKLLCWWKHQWEFRGGHWVIPGKYAITKRECKRCSKFQEILQDHTIGMQTLEREYSNAK